MTKEQKDKIEAQSMCYADVSSAYYLGKKFALKYGKHVLGTSATPFAAKQARNRFRNQLGVKDVKIVPLEKVIREPKKLMEEGVLKKIGRENYDAEVKRIVDLLSPVNAEEMEAVKEVAIDNLIKKSVMESIPWGTIMK
tara:strand:- start:607 stop:1023 length:417 start_codon:yes stop_codon:yes gene_type:complete